MEMVRVSMSDYGLEKDDMVTKTDSLFNPKYSISETTLTGDVAPFKNNGKKLFYFESDIGFINNFGNDLYLIE